MAGKVFLIYGSDEYLVTAKAKQVIGGVLSPEMQETSLDLIDASMGSADEIARSIHRCVDNLRTCGLFSSEKVVWLQDANFLGDKKIGKADAVVAASATLTDCVKKGLPPGHFLVVTAKEIDGRRAFCKCCKDVGELHEFTVSDKSYVAEKQAGTRVDQLLKRAGLRMGQEVRSLFIERVGFDTRQIVGEIEKLVLYVGQRKTIAKEDIMAVTSATREAIAWDLADAFGARDLKRALSVGRQLLFQKESPMRLIMGLESRIKDLLVYREGLDCGWLVSCQGDGGRPAFKWVDLPEDIEEQFLAAYTKDPRKMHWFRVNILAGQARNFSLAQLKKCMAIIVEAHEKLVSSSVPPEMILEFAMAKMLSVRSRTGGRS